MKRHRYLKNWAKVLNIKRDADNAQQQRVGDAKTAMPQHTNASLATTKTNANPNSPRSPKKPHRPKTLPNKRLP